jgi:hypothetical protein
MIAEEKRHSLIHCTEEEKKILGPSILSSRTDSLRTKWVYVICLIKIQRLTLPKLVLYYNKCVGNTLNRYWRKIKCVHVTDGPLALNWIYRDIASHSVRQQLCPSHLQSCRARTSIKTLRILPEARQINPKPCNFVLFDIFQATWWNTASFVQ